MEVEFARASDRPPDRRTVRTGTRVRSVLESFGQHPEGSVVLIDGVSVPLDLPIARTVRLVVIPTFSGG